MQFEIKKLETNAVILLVQRTELSAQIEMQRMKK